MTTPIVTSQPRQVKCNNNIHGPGSRESFTNALQTGQTIYTTWRSCFLRYIDTRPNGDALRKCILEGPYTPSTVIILVVPTMDNSQASEQTTNEIYSTVDACKTAHKMREVIERLQQELPQTPKTECGYHSKEQRNDNQLDSLGNQGQNVATGQGILKKSGMQQSGYIVFNCIRNWVIVLRKQKGALKRVKDSSITRKSVVVQTNCTLLELNTKLANMLLRALPRR
ncbi:hypothetical protein Tco_1145840 [Tanacetum coccineum]